MTTSGLDVPRQALAMNGTAMPTKEIGPAKAVTQAESRLESRISRYFTPDEMIPSAGQGILAVQGRKGEDYGYLDGYCDRDAWITGTAERAYVKYLDGGCSSPVAAFAEVDGDEIFIRGLYYSEATGKWLTGQIRGAAEDGEKLGIALAKQLKSDCERR